MGQEEILGLLKKSVIEMDVDGAIAAAKDALAQKIDPLTCIDKGLSEGMKVISEMFDNGELYVPQIILSAEAFSEAVQILAPHIKGGYSGKAKLIVHTVEGDIHDIGKSLVGTMLSSSGLGKCARPQTKTPSLAKSTGRSFMWTSWKKPSWLKGTLKS